MQLCVVEMVDSAVPSEASRQECNSDNQMTIFLSLFFNLRGGQVGIGLQFSFC